MPLPQVGAPRGFATTACSRLLSWRRALATTGSLAELATVYAHGLAKNHAFIDGNKRVALVSAGAFLRFHGVVLRLHVHTWEGIMVGVASGTVSRDELAAHFAREMGGDPITVV